MVVTKELEVANMWILDLTTVNFPSCPIVAAFDTFAPVTAVVIKDLVKILSIFVTLITITFKFWENNADARSLNRYNFRYFNRVHTISGELSYFIGSFDWNGLFVTRLMCYRAAQLFSGGIRKDSLSRTEFSTPQGQTQACSLGDNTLHGKGTSIYHMRFENVGRGSDNITVDHVGERGKKNITYIFL